MYAIVIISQTGVADVDGVFGEESGGIYGAWGSEGIAKEVESAKLVLLDGNLSVSDLREIVGICKHMKKDVWFEPTSVAKSTRIVAAGVLGEVRYTSPNVSEAMAMSIWIRRDNGADGKLANLANGDKDDEGGLEIAGRTILGVDGIGKRVLLITQGDKGVIQMLQLDNGQISRKDLRATVVDKVVSTTGAGDCLAGRCAGGIAVGEDLNVAMAEAMWLAGQCCGYEASVPLRQDKRASPRL